MAARRRPCDLLRYVCLVRVFSRREIARDSGIVRHFDQKPLTGPQRVLTNNDQINDLDALDNELEDYAKHEETVWLSRCTKSLDARRLDR